MLRSEHIPFNFFVPLHLSLSENQEPVLSFLSALLQRNDLKKVTQFKVEWAPKNKILDDNTSFDTYFELQTVTGKLGVGIEVKYTEKSYPYGATEKDRLSSEESKYYKYWKDCACYEEGSYLKLGSKNLKQFFRNHLLGMVMVENGLIDEFINVHLYPLGNFYQHKESSEFKNFLIECKKHTFIPVTFENFISTGKNTLKEEQFKNWLSYLEDRYIVV